jgi:uncharacterized membrane protein
MEINEYYNILYIGVILVIIDMPVLWYINYDMYKNMFRKINKEPVSIGFHTIVSVILCYLLMGFGLYWFLIKSKTEFSYYNLMLQGFIFGIVLYGVYHTTNLVAINHYSAKVGFIDTIWGGILCALTMAVYVFIHNNFIVNVVHVNTP